MIEQQSYNVNYFATHIMEPVLRAVFRSGRKPRFRLLTVHLDNCPAYRSKASDAFVAENDIVRVPHPA
jgi:hypothetical protein